MDAQALSDSREGGFVVVDALTAVTLAALLLTLVVGTTILSLRSSRASLERRQALAEAELALTVEWPRLGRPGAADGGGGTDRGRWRIDAAPLEETPGLCAVTVEASPSDLRRKTKVETVRFCGPEPRT